MYIERAGEPGVFGSLEPEPLGIKTRSWSRLEKKPGAGAVKKLAGFQPSEKIKSVRKLSYSSLGKIVSFYD